MSGNSFGTLFRITSFGESHGPAIGVVIDGCPAGIPITREEIQKDLDRRRPGQSEFTSHRKEEDRVEILSGVFEGETIGTPIAFIVYNEDVKSEDYKELKDLYRPGHADYTYEAKYGRRDYRGGGRTSARETIARVAAAAIAKKILVDVGISIQGYVCQIGKVSITNVDKSFIENNPLRIPDPSVLEEMMTEIESAKADGDSIGGIVKIMAQGVPPGLGEPVFDKLSAALAHGFMSIPAVKGFEIGDGFAVASQRGSENNDEFVKDENGNIRTKTNHAGGILGGISTGEEIFIRFVVKPPSSIIQKQKTVDKDGNKKVISVQGRHDPCVCPRAVPIGEAMMALVLVDHYLLQKTSDKE